MMTLLFLRQWGACLLEKSTKSRTTPLIAGVLLFLAGIGLAAIPAFGQFGLPLRLLGMVVLAYAGLRKSSLGFWIFFAMLAGFELGLDAPAFAVQLRIFSEIFLRLIKVIVAPLILGTLITGIAGHGDLRKVGRIGWKSLVYFEAVTTLALLIGVAAINLTKAGNGLILPAGNSGATSLPESSPLHWTDLLLHIFPENIVKSMAENQILQVAVFAILFAIAVTLVQEKLRMPILNLAESLTQVMFRFTNIVMYYAPIGVGAAMAYTVGHTGIGVLLPLAKLVLTAYGAILTFLLVVLLPIAYLAGVPIRRFLGAVVEPATIAFATSASEAALPRAMECMETFGVPRRIVAFVIPAGYSFNLDGATLYLALASIFVAQAAGIHLSLSQQLFMVLVLMLSSKGIAGVPRATLIVLLATASMLHLPTEPIFVILGVDALIDMPRTALNVTGNCLAAAVIARWENELPSTPAENTSGAAS